MKGKTELRREYFRDGKLSAVGKIAKAKLYDVREFKNGKVIAAHKR